MRTAIAVGVLCVGITTAHAASPPDSGNSMIEGCRLGLKGEPPPTPHTSATQWLEAGYCAGVMNTYAIAPVAKAVGICLPDGWTVDQGIRVTLLWMQQHPQALDKPFTIIASFALQQTWPCQGTKDKDVGDPGERWRNEFGEPQRVVPR